MSMTRMMCAAVVALAAAGAAQAATPQVKYDDLDLGRPKDAQAYRARIAAASDRVCEREATTGSSYGSQLRECQGRTRSAMLAALPAEVRTAYIDALGGKATDSLTRSRLAAASTDTRAGSPN